MVAQTPKNRKWSAFNAAAIALLLTSPLSLAQFGNSWLDDSCRRDASRYDELQSLKHMVTPGHVADVYVEMFTSKGADRETQSVWRRMNTDDVTVGQAIEAHLLRYHAKRSANDREALKIKIARQIRDMVLIRDLVFSFENTTISAELSAKVLKENWRSQRWDAPNPIKYYVAMIMSKAKGYTSTGLNEEQAAIRAAVEAQAAVDRDRGVSRSMIVDAGNVCFKDTLNRFEVMIRHAAAKGAWTAAEKVEVSGDAIIDSEKLSRLSYYTNYKFGPRDYSFDRLRAWQIAAKDSAGSKKRR